jgi:hypothetical protein
MKESKYSRNDLITELISCQRNNICSEKKFKHSDIKRITKYINGSIFNEHDCTLWNGYITNKNNSKKGSYVNFYFNGKKTALHRLLYINFVGDLSEQEYLKFTCNNCGKCCNIHHLSKFKYNIHEKISSNEIESNIDTFEVVFD